jgi:hypothetical protein
MEDGTAAHREPDSVGRNVAALVKAPAGRAGRPLKSLTLEQAQELLTAAGVPAYTPTAGPGPTGCRGETRRFYTLSPEPSAIRSMRTRRFFVISAKLVSPVIERAAISQAMGTRTTAI